ncbi:MAG: hypothetical protein J0M02_09460 [Planctomycetes bacterium]|nr:hypothetical protein [Planctomycetota bacterium]
MPLRIAVLLPFLLMAACGGGGSDGGGGDDAPAPVDATVTIDNRLAAVAAAPAVNRRLLGSNLQWTDGGDGLLQGGSSNWATASLASAQALAPTVLRYPGGGHADLYHWAAGVGGTRGSCEHAFTGTMQTVWFGTGEFLDLCATTGAEGMITVNTLTGDAAESAGWVRQVNGDPPTGTVPVVRDWEVGNEPYYENTGHPERDVTAAEFAAAYDAHAAAMIAADPRIRVGLPLVARVVWPALNPARRSWNADVLGLITQRVDFAAVHDAYLPFYYPHDRVPDDSELLRTVLSAALVVEADLDVLRAQLTDHGITAPFAMTEHNALGTVFGTFGPIPRSDGLPASQAAAVYTADLLCRLAARDDVDSAQHWSLIGNWMFGAMAGDGTPRPAYRALQGLDAAFTGRRLPVTVAAPVADVAGLGIQPDQTAVPMLGAFACGSGATLRVVLVNRSPESAWQVRVDCRGGAQAGATAHLQILDDADPLACRFDPAGAADWTDAMVPVDAHGLRITLPAHSLGILSIPAATPGAALAPAGDG